MTVNCLMHLSDDDCMAAGSKAGVFLFFCIRALAFRGEATDVTSTVELDAITSTGDAESLAAAVRGNRGWAGACGAAGRVAGSGRAQGWDAAKGAVRVDIRVDIFLEFRFLIILERSLAEAGRESLESGLSVLLANNVLSLTWAIWLWALDLGGWATLWNFSRLAARFAGLGGRVLAGWNVEDVELAASGWLDGEFLGRVVGDAVAVHLVVVPVSLAWLESLGLEAKGSLP